MTTGMMDLKQPYSILLADRHEGFRREVRRVIEEEGGLKVVGEAGDGGQLFEILQETPPDLVILDIAIPNCRGLEATRRIKREFPRVKVLLLTMEQSPEYPAMAAQAGAEGCLLKLETGARLTEAIEAIRRGGTFLPSWRTYR
jgi:two-component system invasion response regulator UvrY